MKADPHFISRVDELSSNKPQDAEARDEIFQALRKPKGHGGRQYAAPTQCEVDNPQERIPGAALTATQYKRMELWAKGKFEADWTGAEPAPTPLDQLPEKDRPQALDRAALEACVGGPFFPGIEASRVMLLTNDLRQTAPVPHQRQLCPRHADRRNGSAVASRLQRLQ